MMMFVGFQISGNGKDTTMIAELTKMLQSAAKGKAPIVAIPIEGCAPMCLDRKRLVLAIKGVDITNIIQLDNRWLKIEGRVMSSDGVYRVKTSSTFPPIERWKALIAIRDWAEKERKTNMKIIAQGAIGAAALKAAKREAKRQEKAAKLIQMEKGGCKELEDAQREVGVILCAARNHGRGATRHLYEYEQREVEAKKAETVLRHVSHHNVSHRVRKSAAVIRWRLKALHTAWFEVTKFNRNRRKTTANKFLKVKKAIRVIQIVKDHNALMTQLERILPARIPNPRWPGEEYHNVFGIDPLHRPNSHKKDHPHHYYDSEDRYDRAALAMRLREARETIRVLTPPVDEEMDIAA